MNMIVRPNGCDAEHPTYGAPCNGAPMNHNISFNDSQTHVGANVDRSGGGAGFGYPMDAGNGHQPIPVYPGVPSCMIPKE